MVMTVQCPECQTEFPIDPAKVPEAGVRAQCSNCPGIFPVFRPEGEQDGAPDGGLTTDADPGPAITDSAEVEAASQFDAVFATPETDSFEMPVAEDETGGDGGDGAVLADDAAGPEGDEEGAEEEAESEASAKAEFDNYFERTFEGDDLPSLTSSYDSAAPAGDGIGTLEQSQEEARQGLAGSGEEPEADAGESLVVDTEGLEVTDLSGGVGTSMGSTVEEDQPLHAAPSAPAAPIQFGKRDPLDKARRLARVLVSDMIVYHRDKHAQALAAGTLKEEFQDEVEKSMEEYVDQVGQEIADTTEFFRDALNDILAKGQEIF